MYGYTRVLCMGIPELNVWVYRAMCMGILKPMYTDTQNLFEYTRALCMDIMRPFLWVYQPCVRVCRSLVYEYTKALCTPLLYSPLMDNNTLGLPQETKYRIPNQSVYRRDF